MKYSLATLLLSVSFASCLQIIPTIGGNGVPGHSGDGRQATYTELRHPPGIDIEVFSNRKNFSETQ